MNKNIAKKVGIISGALILLLYVMFLIVPFFLNSIASSCGHFITSTVKDSAGFVVKFENIRFVTTPKLTAGARIGKLTVGLPTGEVFISLEDAYGKISLIPLLVRKIELDSVGADNLVVSVKVKKDGKFLIEDFIKETSTVNSTQEVSAPVTELPFGFKLSNHLPNIRVNDYKFSFIDMLTNDEYYLQGKNFIISDFIINKKVKLSTSGKIVLAQRVPFNFDLKVFNKIMPDTNLNDLVFSPVTVEENKKDNNFNINIIDIFKTINKNLITANVSANVKTYGSFDDVNIDGIINVDKISVAKDGKSLPDGHLYFTHKGKNIKLDSGFYTAENELTSFNGFIKTGKNPDIDITCKSNATFDNVFSVFDSIAKSVNYNDLETLTARGGINADFNIKAGKKTVKSSGYLKIPSASINYALYNVLIDKIVADIDFSNNKVNVKDLGFSVLGQPFKVYGTIEPDTTTDLHLLGENLSIKGLLTAAGQFALLKENDIKSGILSLNASVSGKFKKLVPLVDLKLDNLNVLNKPSNTTVKMSNSKFNISAEDNSYKGILDIDSVQILNPMAKILVPRAKITIDPSDINIADTYLVYDNSRIDIEGSVEDYASKNLSINILAKGDILARDILSTIPKDFRSYFSQVGKIPVYVTLTGNDKTQYIKAQMLATPSGYFNILKINQLSGKNTLLTSSMKIANDAIEFSDTGLYIAAVNELPVSKLSIPLVSVTGAVEKLSSKQVLNNVRLSIPSMLDFEVPGFKNSKASGMGNIVLNGSIMAPSFKGSLDIPEVSIQQLKTLLKNVTVDIGTKSIHINVPSITVDNSVMRATANLSSNFNSGVIVNNLDYHADMFDSDTLIKAMEGLPAQNSSASTSNSNSSSSQNLGVIIQKGRGTISKFKSGNIAATNLASNLSLKNNTLYLQSLVGEAFDGKFDGDISVNLISGFTKVVFKGAGMNAEKAIAGAAGIKNALSGNLNFNANLTLDAYSPSEADMMKSLKGDVSFDIQDGIYGNIGRLENMLFAQNIVSNGIMSAALTPVVNMPVVKSTANFKSLTGDLTLNNGWAKLNSIKSAGPSMSAFIFGQYNLLNASANVTILGRLGADVVKVLGPLGELSVDKLTSYLPKFGTATAKILNSMTTNPNGERTSEIPQLSNGNTNYKDFKVLFNGGIESKSSVKSFKWLSVCDTSQIEGGSLKEQLQQSQESLNQLRKQKAEDIKKTVETVKDSAKQTSEELKNQIQNTKDSINELKNLFKRPSQNNNATQEPAS